VRIYQHHCFAAAAAAVSAVPAVAVLIVFGATGTVGQALLQCVMKDTHLGKDVKVRAFGRYNCSIIMGSLMCCSLSLYHCCCCSQHSAALCDEGHTPGLRSEGGKPACLPAGCCCSCCCFGWFFLFCSLAAGCCSV
jgi:hypothetical protein